MQNNVRDQEPAIEDLLREIARHRGDLETVLEFNPVRDSQGNGVAEKGVQTLEGIARTHLLELDEKLGRKLPLDLPWFNWMIEFCADMHNRFQVGPDGRTPWERLKRRKSQGWITEFGRQVLQRVPGKVVGGIMQPRWYGGVFLGRRLETNEVNVSTEEGVVVRARDFRDVPDNVAFQP